MEVIEVKIPSKFHAKMRDTVGSFIADIELCSHKMSANEIDATKQFIDAIENAKIKGKSIIYIFDNGVGFQRLIKEAEWLVEYESADYLGSADAVDYAMRNAAKQVLKQVKR